jgi:hypothetical protein
MFVTVGWPLVFSTVISASLEATPPMKPWLPDKMVLAPV